MGESELTELAGSGEKSGIAAVHFPAPFLLTGTGNEGCSIDKCARIAFGPNTNAFFSSGAWFVRLIIHLSAFQKVQNNLDSILFVLQPQDGLLVLHHNGEVEVPRNW